MTFLWQPFAMLRLGPRSLWPGLAALLMTVAAWAEEAWPPVDAYSPAAELADAARRRGLPLGGITLAAPGKPPVPGDSVVLLVVLDEREQQTQWLVGLTGPLGIREPRTDGRARVLYAMDGRALRFPERRETYAILALGPWRTSSGPAKVAVRDLQVDMNAAFLDERFDQAADFMFRTGRARLEGKLRPDEWFSIQPGPPERPDGSARQRFVEAAALTDADERALAATVPALDEFARVIAETPGLRDVLFSVVEKPSLWSVLGRFGRLETDFRFHSAAVVPLAEPPLGFAGTGACHIVPFTFSITGKPALGCTMLVAQARPPLRMSGGILAVVARSPERADVRLIVRVIAARPGVPET